LENELVWWISFCKRNERSYKEIKANYGSYFCFSKNKVCLSFQL